MRMSPLRQAYVVRILLYLVEIAQNPGVKRNSIEHPKTNYEFHILRIVPKVKTINQMKGILRSVCVQTAQFPSLLQSFLHDKSSCKFSPPSSPTSVLGLEFFPAVCLRLVQFVIHTGVCVYYKLHKNEPLYCFVTIFADNTSHVFTILCRAKILTKRLWVLLLVSARELSNFTK